MGKERTKLDELQAELCKHEPQASHIQHLIDHGPDSGDELGDEEEGSDIWMSIICLWGKTEALE